MERWDVYSTVNPLASRGGQVEVEIAGEILSCDYADMRLYTRNADHTPLSSRAWALQERQLAPRNLHFGVSDIIWECRTKCASETFPEALPKSLSHHETFILIHEIGKPWEEIAFLYSSASLTYRRDKLAALAGIARKIHN